MPLDVFDRDVQGSIEDLRKALLGDMGKEKAAKKDENTEELKKLNDNLQKIVGTDLDRELKALNKLIKRVADCCEDISNKKSGRDNLEKQAAAFGKAVARSLNPTLGGSIEDAVERAVSDLNPAFDGLADKTRTFGEVLERSQRRFSTAFAMIGKDFEKTFGASIRDRISKLNPFKWFQKEGEKTADESRNVFLDMWKGLSSRASSMWNGVKDAWTGTTNKVANLWGNLTTKVGGWWEGVKDKVSDAWEAAAKKLGSTWLGKGAVAIGSTLGFVGRTVGRFGKATVGTVTDLLGINKLIRKAKRGAKRDTDDMTGGGTPTEMQGEGEAYADKLVQEMDKNELQLCQCICKCIQELMGANQKGQADILQTTKKTGGFTEKLFKTEKKANQDTSKVEKSGKGAEKARAGFLGTIGQGINKLLGRGEKGESQEKLMRDYFQQQRKERMGRAGEVARGKALYATSAASRMVFGEKPMEALLAGAAQSIAKVGGKAIEAPFWAIGELIEKSTIPGLTALGPVVKMAGAALGGLAEGLINFVLTPLLEQMDMMDQQSKAMFVSTGATTAAPGIQMAGKPQIGEEWSDIAKRVAEANNNMDSTARTLEKLGTYMDDVGETGQRFTTIQKTMLKNFKRGIQDTKTLNKVTKIGLQTAYLMDASAESTAELFADWHQRLGMSTTDLRGMQRNLQQIGRNTGIIGDELVQVAKSAHSFMENMRMAGNLTTTAAKNIIELTARARKTGTEGATGRILDTLGKGILRGGGGPKEQAMVAVGTRGRPDLARKALEGTLLDADEDVKAFANNLEDYTRKLIKADPTKSLEENIKRLTPSQRARFSAMMESVFGVGLNEMGIVINNMKETAKSFQERLDDYAKAARGPTMSLEELQGVMDKGGGDWRKTFDKLVAEKGDIGKAIDEMLNMEKLPKELRKQLEGQLSAQQADYQRQQLFLKTGADLLDEFNNTIKDGKTNFQDAVAELSKKKNFQEYFKAIGAEGAKGGEAIQAALEDQAKRMKAEAKKLGKSEIANMLPTSEEIKAALAGGKPEDMQAIADRFTRAQGVLAKQGMQVVNPVENIKQGVFQIEAHFRELMQSAIFQAMPFLTEALKQLNQAPFWEAFRKGDIQLGIKLLGEFIEKMAENIMNAMGQVRGLANTPGFTKFIAGFVEGAALVAKPLLEAVGKFIQDNAPGLAKFFEEALKFLNETDWGEVGKALGVVVGALTMIGTIMSVGGTLLVGLGAFIGLLSGPAGLIAVLAGGYVLLSNAKKEVDKNLEESGKGIKKAVENRVKETDKVLAERKDTVGKMTDEELKNNIKDTQKEIQRLNDVARHMTDELQNALTSASGVIAEASGFGSTNKIVEEHNKALNEITKAQQDAKRLLEQAQKEMLRRATEGKSPEEITKEAQKAKEKSDVAGKAQTAMWDKLNEATGGRDWKVDELRKDEARLNKIAEVTGKTRDEIYEIVNKHYSRFGTSDDLEARQDINRLISRSGAYQQLEAEKTSEFRKSQEIGGTLQASYEGQKKTKKEYFMSQFGDIQDEKAKKILENYIDRFLKVQMSSAKELGLGDVKDVGMFKAPDELKDPEKYKKWREEMETFQARMKELTGTTIDLNEINKKMIEQTTKLNATNKSATDAATQLLASSKDVKKADDLRTYETVLGTTIMAKNFEEAQRIAAKQNTMIEDREKVKKGLIDRGLITQEDTTKKQLSPENVEKYAGKLVGKITEKQVQEFDVTKKLLEEKDPEKQAKMYEVLRKQMVQNMDFQKMSWEDYEKLLTQLATLQKAQEMYIQEQNKSAKVADPNFVGPLPLEKMAKEATTKTGGGSIYTHDLHLEKMLGGSPLVDPAAADIEDVTIKPIVDNNTTMTPMLPGTARDAEEEMRKNQAELAVQSDVDMAKTESNTGAAAAGTWATVKMLGRLGKMLSKKLGGNSLAGVEGADYPIEPFMEDILGTEWRNGDPNRTVGFEVEYSDIT